jgi:hypothetical protein
MESMRKYDKEAIRGDRPKELNLKKKIKLLFFP